MTGRSGTVIGLSVELQPGWIYNALVDLCPTTVRLPYDDIASIEVEQVPSLGRMPKICLEVS